MINSNPIGLFDSGIGGTSIWKEIHQLMPNENTIYLADSKNAPYGQKTKDEIIALSIKNTEYLLNQNAKIIVVACNTATTNAIKELRAKYDVPFIGIEPAIKPAANNSRTQTIGILATKGTLNSELFNKTAEQFQDTNIIEQVGYNLVKLIEDGEMHSDEMTSLLKTYLTPMIEANIDYLVLGCSHYPYLIPQIKEILPQHIKIIDSGEAVARQTYKVLEEKIGLNTAVGEHSTLFYTNSDPKVLKSILENKYPVIQKDF
ncbi:glutamate racemase [Flavobacterium lindanitolerans]|uniref:Glutamate racemase n=1 Tax=Flavobacterium lindanitolerans TaxID=428988 RepID=A0A497UZ21_9FLAO|nr:glutamate racemase [Flavobacterium lindanitolerans]THD31744.1 MAG: glutamate racemase [Flavobacterium johnsoniae]MBC8643124.1 glutamate racemase [Flavobacterium lindanitolerans]MBL7866999.1 glutamate racemase [Flavobacterium lindanitolerans]MDQ7960326.1 glutamate racemase [Flavobacterium lindanitolerans]PKW29363.1 glutamate racemase [Flavobacterium lindanitolerans]